MSIFLRMLRRLISGGLAVVLGLTLCVLAFLALSHLLSPAQTAFPDGSLPERFIAVVRVKASSGPGLEYEILRGRAAIQERFAQDPVAFRMITGKGGTKRGDDPGGFFVLEDASAFQVIEVSQFTTASTTSRYRLESGRIAPLYFRVDGGFMVLIVGFPGFIFALWLAARASAWLMCRLWPLSASSR